MLQIEGNVDKTTRSLSDWRTAEAKSKKHSHTAARENEKLQDATLEIRSAFCDSLDDDNVLFPYLNCRL